MVLSQSAPGPDRPLGAGRGTLSLLGPPPLPLSLLLPLPALLPRAVVAPLCALANHLAGIYAGLPLYLDGYPYIEVLT